MCINIGILSSIGETEYSGTAEFRKIAKDAGKSDEEIAKLYQTVWLDIDAQVSIPDIVPCDVTAMTQTDVCITKYQHRYFAAER